MIENKSVCLIINKKVMKKSLVLVFGLVAVTVMASCTNNATPSVNPTNTDSTVVVPVDSTNTPDSTTH